MFVLKELFFKIEQVSVRKICMCLALANAAYFMIQVNKTKPRFAGGRNSDSFLVPFFYHRHSNVPVIYDVLQSSDSTWSVIGQCALNSSNDDGQLQMSNGTKAIRPANRLRVTTILARPFAYFDNKSETDPSKLNGYAIDLLKELSRLDGFEYELHFVKDGQYGGIDETTSQWNGMIGEVQKGEADLALAPITLTSERAQVVNFLPSFMRLELKFLIVRSFNTSYAYNPFSFLDPFDSSFYEVVIVSVLLLAFLLTTLSTISPYGTRGKFFLSRRAEKAEEALEANRNAEHFSQVSRRHRILLNDRRDAYTGMGFNNSLHFVWSALFCQSPERAPQSFSGKILALAWFFASTVFVAYYTANVVTSVSLHTKTVNVIRSAEDLLLQPSIGFGTLANSATQTQLRESDTSIGRQMYRTITSGKSPLHHSVYSIAEALDLIGEETFAFIADSIVVDFLAVESKCELKTVPLGFGSNEYALAVQKSFPFFHSLTHKIGALKGTNFFRMLWNKYFSNLDSCNELDHSDDSVRSLTFTDLAGVFYMVAFTLAVGFIVLAIEWILASFDDVTSRKPNAPSTLGEALRMRKNKLLHDIRWEWFPIEKYMKKWKKLRLPTDGAAEAVLMNHFTSSHRRSRHVISKRLSRSLSSLDLIAPSPEVSYTTTQSRFSGKRLSDRLSIRKSILRQDDRSKRFSFRNSRVAAARQVSFSTEQDSDWYRHGRF